MIETLRVLVVDDQLSMRQLVASLLRGIGVRHVDAAEDGESALRIMEQVRINLVLLDIEMPGIGGLATLRAIRSSPQLGETPVIMMTGKSQADLVKEIVSLGVSGYLVKPVSTAKLRANLAAVASKMTRQTYLTTGATLELD